MSDKIRELIREVFLRNGFTIKEGQTDLKQYVYAAAEELLQAALAQNPAQAVPDGWKLVPLTPEGGMLDNATRCVVTAGDGADYVGRDEAAEIYRAMLAASPAAPAPAAQEPAAYVPSADIERLKDSRIAGIFSSLESVARPGLVAVFISPPAAEQPEKLIDRPAKVGAVRFNVGTPERHVVEAAQRHYEYEKSPPFRDEQVAGLAKVLKQAEQPDAVKVARELLDERDMHWLRRFKECCDDPDSDGHDLPKSAVRSLEQIGALRSLGFGRREITKFGEYLLSGDDKE